MNNSEINFSAPRAHLVLAANGGFVAATLREAATVRASEAHASKRVRERVTAAAVRRLGRPFVVGAVGEGNSLLLTESEAKALAFKLSRSQTRNRLSAGRGRRRRRA